MLSTLALLAILPTADASSHREAPAISRDPAADITDFYMFVSPEDSSKVVILMNVLPLQAPYSGPNFHNFDDDVMYSINIDNEGDGEEDIVFQFQTNTTYNIPETFLYNDGYYFNAPNTQIDGIEDINIAQTYTVTRLDDGVASEIISGASVAPANVGDRSVVAGGYFPDDTTPGSITTSHTYSSGSYRTFAGPRQEGFYVDLGRTFDLLGVGLGGNSNSLLGFNVHTIAIEVDAAMLTRDGAAPSAGAQNDVIAAWATTSRRAVTVRRANGSTEGRGPWVQVGRLGNPLVNEAVLPISEKDTFNASHPRDDLQFLSWVNTPLLPVYMNVVLGTYLPSDVEADIIPSLVDNGADVGGREDLVLAFLTGFSGFGTAPGGYYFTGPIPGETGKNFSAFEALRLNIAGNGAGYWPDGRWVEDDVVDTALFALAGGVLGLSGAVSDGVDSTGLSYLDTFPFLGDPWSGATY